MPATTQAVILVGGRGTRLGALTNDTPKPLLDVAGRPFLSYLVDSLERQGFNDILLLAGYQADKVAAFAQQNARAGLRLRCVAEEAPLGTGGALVNALPYLAESFIVLNGDTLFNIDLNDLAAPLAGGTLVRLALRRVPDTSRYGRVVLEGEKIVAMQEKGLSGEGLINGGIYYISKSCLEMLPEGECSLERDLFQNLIEERYVEGQEYNAFFLDIGVPEDYENAQLLVPGICTLKT